ncbi:hypothetical protein KSS87_017511, partial [Heliosperma pusillum]
VQTTVLSMDPLPSINRTLGLLQKIEKQKVLNDTANEVSIESASFVSKKRFNNSSYQGQTSKKPKDFDGNVNTCDHCNKHGHVIVDCHRLKTCTYCNINGHIIERCYKYRAFVAKKGKARNNDAVVQVVNNVSATAHFQDEEYVDISSMDSIVPYTQPVHYPGMPASVSSDMRHNSFVCSSKGFEFSSEISLKEENDESKARDGVLIREKEEEEEEEVKLERKRELGLKNTRKQLIKRSSLVAKQVIGIHSACSLGFVSQLWVDTASWILLEIEVRPSLLSSEYGKVLLEDIERVGDVVLVQDETFVFNEFRMVGLETLVGYSVVTPEGRNLGKVRIPALSYLISAGLSFVLSDRCACVSNYLFLSNFLKVSTYALFTEDVQQVVSDTIIVHETAASRIQRLTRVPLNFTVSVIVCYL